RPSFQPRRSSLTWASTVWSWVLPGQHHTLTGIPSRVTASRSRSAAGRRGGPWTCVAAKPAGPILPLVAFEVGGGGGEEQQVDLQVEQVGDREAHRLLHLGLRVGLHQQVHRPVRLVVV